MAEEFLLEVEDLVIDYVAPTRSVRALDYVSFQLRPGEVLGLAGESGCGKSTLARALIRLLGPPAVITGGRIRFKGRDVLDMSESELRSFRWREVAMVYQSALDALSPVLTVGEQIADAIRAHESPSAAALDARVVELMTLVGIDPARRHAFPHTMSGGMRQRVIIAMALALRPPLLIMDEPTTALDVIVQREILQQIRKLQRQLGFSVLFITHDLPLMLELCDRIAVLYSGRLAEIAPSSVLKDKPLHPYTCGLMKAFPSLDGPKVPIEGIPGYAPSLASPPRGCRFHPRCSFVQPVCAAEVPLLISLGPQHRAACHQLTAVNPS